MPKPQLLVINDTSDYINSWQTFRWFKNSDEVLLKIASKKDVIDGLNRLIEQHLIFDRVVVRTHGWHTGIIWFGDDKIGADDWPVLAGKIKFAKLFPGRTKVYFDACETADGEVGTQFLIKSWRKLTPGWRWIDHWLD